MIPVLQEKRPVGVVDIGRNGLGLDDKLFILPDESHTEYLLRVCGSGWFCLLLQQGRELQEKFEVRNLSFRKTRRRQAGLCLAFALRTAHRHYRVLSCCEACSIQCWYKICTPDVAMKKKVRGWENTLSEYVVSCSRVCVSHYIGYS